MHSTLSMHLMLSMLLSRTRTPCKFGAMGFEHSPVVKEVWRLLRQGIRLGASDIHLEPKRDEAWVRMRIDGVMHRVHRLPKVVFPAMVSRVKMLGRMDIAERRRPQDGRFKTQHKNDEVELRVSTVPTAFGEKVVIRIFDPGVLRQELDSLGFFPREMAIYKRMLAIKNGMVLVVGPTGSGKTTTLYSSLHHINSPRINIVTLEDPIEFVFSDDKSVIEQREIGLDSKSFAAGLKHVLRQDPDVIMIGEMRDAISFSAAMSAADTGHLVLSTLHTTNAAQSVTRILDFFRSEERDQIRRQLAGTLKAVVCQRMVGRAGGGVIPAIEVMVNTPTMRKLIEENRLEKLGVGIETGGEDGMQNFNQALFKLVQDRLVTEEEALSKASNADALKMNFQGIFLSEGKRILS